MRDALRKQTQPDQGEERQRQTAACEGQIHHPAAGDRHQPGDSAEHQRHSCQHDRQLPPAAPDAGEQQRDHRQRTGLSRVNIPPQNAINIDIAFSSLCRRCREWQPRHYSKAM